MESLDPFFRRQKVFGLYIQRYENTAKAVNVLCNSNCINTYVLSLYLVPRVVICVNK